MNTSSYQGQREDIGFILALKSENFDRRIWFQIFLDKVSSYIVSKLEAGSWKLDNGGDGQPLYTDLEDPTQSFQLNNMPIKLDASNDDVNEIDMEIYHEEVNQFVRRKATLQRNLEKSYGLIWGQCLAGLQTYIRGLTSF